MAWVPSIEEYWDSYSEDEDVPFDDKAISSLKLVTGVEEQHEEDSESKHVGNKVITEEERKQTSPILTPIVYKRPDGKPERANDTRSTTALDPSQAWTPNLSPIKQRSTIRRIGAHRGSGLLERSRDDSAVSWCENPYREEEYRSFSRPLSRNSSLNSPGAVSKHERIRDSQTWRGTSIVLVGEPSKIPVPFEVGQLVWIGSVTNMSGSILLGHEDFKPPSNAWNHLALLYTKHIAPGREICFECLKITSYSNCESTEERTMAAVKWSREIVPCRRLLYLPIEDDHPATVSEHMTLNMPVLTFEEGEKLEKTSYVNVERSFIIEERLLQDNLAQRTVLSKESMQAIRKYRKDRQYEGVFDPQSGRPITRKEMSRQLDSKGNGEDKWHENQGGQFARFTTDHFF